MGQLKIKNIVGPYRSSKESMWTQVFILSKCNGKRFMLTINKNAPGSVLYDWSDHDGWINPWYLPQELTIDTRNIAPEDANQYMYVEVLNFAIKKILSDSVCENKDRQFVFKHKNFPTATIRLTEQSDRYEALTVLSCMVQNCNEWEQII